MSERRLAVPRFGISLLSVLSVLIGLFVARAAEAELHVAVAWDDDGAGTSHVGLVAASDPGAFLQTPITVPGDGVLRFANGELFHVSRSADIVTRIALTSQGLAPTATIAVGAGFELRDLAVVSADAAWLSARARTTLLRLDLATGTVTQGIDLAPLGVAPGVLSPERMLVHDGRVYLQLRRPLGSNQTSYVAVIDIATESIVDADPVATGVQGIALEGTEPRHKMQVIPGTSRLMLSATGALLDDGGIETIDLETLTSEGVLLSDNGHFPTNDFGPFVMLDSAIGWFSGATSIVESSHLFRVDITNPGPTSAVGNEVFFTSPNLVHDPATNRLFWPIPDGLRFYDATTGAEDPASPAFLLSGTTTDIEPVLLPPPVPGPGAGLPTAVGLLVGSLAFAVRRLGR